MASAALRDELNCSICLGLYTDPVSLRCGHNFCRSCIVSVLDAQEEAGGHFCPDCGAEYRQRPSLKKNRKLGNLVERFSSSQPDPEETRIFCTYCTESPVPAVQSCLHYGKSMCQEHLRAYNMSVNHSVIDPTASFGGRKCSTHDEILKYYCLTDTACICVSCWMAGDHKGHDVELLEVAAEKEKEKLRPVIEKLTSEREEAGRRVQNLKDHGNKQMEKSDRITENVSALFCDLKENLDDLEKKVQDDLSRQKDQVSLSVSDLVRQVELHKDDLTKKLNQLEGLCSITDPVTFLQGDLNSDDIINRRCDVIDTKDAQRMDASIAFHMLHRGLEYLADDVIDLKIKKQFSVMQKSEVLLDVDTANNYIIVSLDLRSASYTATSQNRPDGPQRFNVYQVLSYQSFSSGTHYWEVDVIQARKWLIGVAAESLERKVVGDESYIGYNENSWALRLSEGLAVIHNNFHKQLVLCTPVRVVRIYLDYEAGQLSFYQLCNPVRHLHTFSASFTEPLYAAFYVHEGCSLRILE